ncbi:zinc transporter, ZIP family [Dethiosulfatibacter aminovorans DSM 17477]|uniref:Zinc transporter, ZIP family n=1 Tax=Dethiosulfatibacter aminovorans DSM 17477 TaxID=1121476 RepID=A0A1M6AA63_9FIRM|nr:ZIP family metal transporter [Dethiosulfatibacter aminovorans]SHI33307.1 zinc transporter, ZIP family [Dethiosulfatibacter aminovorans DSM 17477]
MLEWLQQFNPIIQALFGTLFTYALTALGAALVFFFKSINRMVLNGMLGFAAGVMIAASFWSLLSPSIDMAEDLGQIPWITASIGFLAGGAFLWIVDKILPHLHDGLKTEHREGIKTNWQRSVLLVLAITLHNIPEGLAVGVAFGAVAYGLPSASIAGAVALAIGIGLQNFPEGAAVSIPLRREGLSRKKAFMYGQASGIVEPIAGVLGAAAVISMRPILPYALAFAAGAMIYVVAEELIPEGKVEATDFSDVATIGVMLGFAVMMILDVALG